ncbi:MAG: pilus assembly protein CpaF [Bermanella sp.]|jgi:pilus assembly protein CpaF
MNIVSLDKANAAPSDEYQRLKAALHRFVIERIEDEDVFYDGDTQRLSKSIAAYISQYCRIYEFPIADDEQGILEKELLDEIAGYGPLQSLLEDPTVNDILINGPTSIFIERNGILEKTKLRFLDDKHVLRVIRRMISPLGRRIDESSPLVDGRLPDGSRINAIVPPLSLEGPCLSIRKFRQEALTEDDLVSGGSISQEAMEFLKDAVHTRRNILISGATGSGKTTLLNALSQFITEGQRIVTIEDAAELQLQHGHVVRLETRPPNNEGIGEVGARELLRNALRMRPDRIIVGESRGGEVLDMLQAMNTGHSGSMSTVHANSAEDAVTRLEMMIGLADFKGSDTLCQKMISSALDYIVHVGRCNDGHRAVLEIAEVTGKQCELEPVFCYDQTTRTMNRTGAKNGVQVERRSAANTPPPDGRLS